MKKINNQFQDDDADGFGTPASKLNESEFGKTTTNSDSPIIPKGLGKLDTFYTSIKELEEMSNRKFLIDGLIQEKSHTVIFGASGTGKTTLMFYFTKEAKQNNPDLITYYFLLDGADQIALNGAKYYGDEETLKIINLKQAKEIMEELRNIISIKQDLSNFLFVFDTYKKFQSDVNNKGANASHMHILRELTNLGATIVSIAHTNKDGKRISGTAEMEQDADAVIRITKMKSVSKVDMMTISLSEGGRIRWKFMPRSYELPSDNPNPSLIEHIEYVDLSEAEFLEEHSGDISIIRSSLAEDGDGNQAILHKRLEEDVSGGRDKFFELLRKGRGKFWNAKKTSNNSYIYSSKEG